MRRLRLFHANIGKRLVKSPKVYVRDSGLVHALLGIGDRNELAGHPVVGTSWEGFVIENLLAAAPPRTVPSFYRTAAGTISSLTYPAGTSVGRSRSREDWPSRRTKDFTSHVKT